MPLIPLSFVFTLVLCVPIYQFIREGKVKTHTVFFALFVVQAIQSVLIGLSWGYGLREVLVLQSLIATAIPPLIWLSYQSLIHHVKLRDLLPHSLPCATMIVVHVLGLQAFIDIIIMVTFSAYGLAILHVARKGEDVLSRVRHDSSERCFYLFRLTGYMLLLSAALEAIIWLDFTLTGGQTAGALVSVGNLCFLLVLWLAAFIIQQGKAEPDANGLTDPNDSTVNTQQTSDELSHIASQINTLMQDGLYKDLELNTTKIARKVGVPVRKISQAINRTHGKSVSQYVNQFRVDEACRLLSSSDDSITQIALNAGFMTKSNFHREFSRLTQTTPTQWRKASTPTE